MDREFLHRAAPRIPELYPHQRIESRIGWREPIRALFWAPRAGKTLAICVTALKQYAAGVIDSVVVFAPNGVHVNWAEFELNRYLMPRDHYVYCWDARRSAVEQMRAFSYVWTNPRRTLRWYVFSSSVFAAPSFEPIFRRLRKPGDARILLVADEAHEYRTPSSKRSRRIRALARAATTRRILTGTPAANTPLGTWAQFEILAPGILGYRRYSDFENRYGVFKTRRGPHGSYPKLVGHRDLDDLWARVGRYTSWVSRQDCIDMSRIVERIEQVEVFEAQRVAYTHAVKTLKKQTANSPVRGMDAAMCIMQMQCIAGGYLRYVDTPGDPNIAESRFEALIHPADNPRIQRCIQLVESTRACLIYARFRHEIDALYAEIHAAGYAVAIYDGRTPTPWRAGIRRQFSRGDLQVIVGQPQACGIGVDFSRATRIIWYSQVFDAHVIIQANERASELAATAGAVEVISLSSLPIDSFIRRNLRYKANTSMPEITIRDAQNLSN